MSFKVKRESIAKKLIEVAEEKLKDIRTEINPGNLVGDREFAAYLARELGRLAKDIEKLIEEEV